MSYFKGAYLQVTTPVTSDGLNLVYDENKQPKVKIHHLPVTARKHIEKKNAKLPPQLRMKIEEMQPYAATPAPKVTKGTKA